ncbi:MAG: hypothetical protein R2789_02980 [Microthrixaceae bacterium]
MNPNQVRGGRGALGATDPRDLRCCGGARGGSCGVPRVRRLGDDAGEATNDFPYAFWQAGCGPGGEASAAILVEEKPDVLTVYDDNGGYGHSRSHSGAPPVTGPPR